MNDQSFSLLKALCASAPDWRDVPFTREAWSDEFPADTVETPLGPIDLRPECLKAYQADGLSLMGALRPCLESPAYIAVRDGALEFYRAFNQPGGLLGGYVCASVANGSVSLSVTDQPQNLPERIAAVGQWTAIDAEPGQVADSVVFKSLYADGLLLTDFDLAMTAMGLSPAPDNELVKADASAVPAGARWITVHPNGDNGKGVPVLVQEEKHGSGVFRVVGGAGGKLNYLKLRGVKSESEYRADASKRAADKKAVKKAQVESDKRAGIHEAKQAARKGIKEQSKEAEREFIRTVADAMGWELDKVLDVKSVKLDKPLTDAAEKAAEKDRHAQLLAKAKEAVRLQRAKLVSDGEARAAAGLGVVPLNAAPDELSVEDLNPIRISDGSGVNHSFKERSGLTDDKLAESVRAVDEAEHGALAVQMKAAAAVERGEAKAAIKSELENLPKADLKPKVAEAKKAVAMIAAEKRMRAMKAAARDATKAVDVSHVEPKAYVLAVESPSIDDVAKEIADDVRTATAAALLSDIDVAGGADSLSSHVFSGAHSTINAVMQAVAGASLIDRSAIDVLGVAGAAQVLARRLHNSLSPERVREALSAIEQHHADSQTDRVQSAMAEAKELQEAAAEIEQGEAESASDLVAAVELSRQRKQHLADAKRVLGRALGEMEASAAMVQALGEKPRNEVQLSLGKTSLESGIRQMYALGLTADDFKVDRAAGNVFVTLNAGGMDKLAAAPDAENMERVQRNLSIQRGEFDEDNWLPEGFANRPDLALQTKPGVSPKLAEPFDFQSADVAQAMRDYVGGRYADGDSAIDILHDLQSSPFFAQAADKDAYRAALDEVMPLKGEDGEAARIETLAPRLDQYADAFVQSRWGGKRSALNKQGFEADDKAQDALHRALSDEPAGKAAYKPVGELTRDDARMLRGFFAQHIAHESGDEAALRERVESLASQEPERFSVDIFGESSESPEWQSWRSALDAAKAAHTASKLDWPTYCTMMHGRVRALEAVQDCVRSVVSKGFADHYAKLKPDAALKVGRAPIRGDLNHLGAIDPAEREKRLAERRELIDGLRERDNGRYAAGGVADKMDAAQDSRAAFGQAQLGMFGGEEVLEAEQEKPLRPGERYTIGHAAESKIESMMQIVGKNFKAGQPVKIFQPSMSGPDGIKRQRAIKLITANKRVILAAGVGSGKTGIGLGAFAHLHAQGAVKKGLFVVPSIVQDQFHAEALRFLKPGQFDWHAEPGASYESRLAAYKDPGKHFAVVTHQSFRDDLLRMASEAGHGSPDDIAARLGAMSKTERSVFTKGVLDHHGIDFGYVMADEAHGLLNRDGKENSRLSNVVEGVTDNAEYYVHASGDPTKNDASEAYSLLEKMDGQRYNDKDAFMRRYGGDTLAAREGLHRELARHLYAMDIKPNVAARKSIETVPLSDGQRKALDQIDKHAAALRIAKMEGRTDIEAAKAMAPAMFDGVEDSKHDDVARRVSDSVGILKESAIKRALNAHAESAKLDAVSKHAAQRKGKQGVVFAHSLDAVEAISKRLQAEGHRVVTITGKDSSKAKGEKIRAFNPDKGDAEADIVVCSDAGATGANLQSGQWLMQYDTPDTAMTHAQRQGRINRIGQRNPDIDLIDLVADHESERRARSRLANKYGLRSLMTSPLESLDDTGIGSYLAHTGQGGQAQDSLF